MTDFHALLQYNRDTGIIRWRKNEAIAGTKRPDGYTQVQVGGRRYLTHRLIWKMETGQWPVALIDHIDGDRSNNKWLNLREATRAQNSVNRLASKRNSSGHCGVSFRPDSRKWRARLARKYYGDFDSKELAIAARDEIAQAIYGEYARTKATRPDAHSVRSAEALIDADLAEQEGR